MSIEIRLQPAPYSGSRSQLIGPACPVDQPDHCITCGDEALEARVVSVDDMTAMAVVAIEDETTEVDISLVDPLVPGDLVLVHGGVALERLDRT